MAETLTILGASARAAAFSAVRAGFAPVVGDLFADVDLAACCAATRVGRYPHDLERVCAGPQSGPWMYTGALENWPHLVERMARRRPLLGASAASLCKVRDPLRLRKALAAAGIDAPRVTLDPREVPQDGSWLRKPLRSAGGHHIEHFAGAMPSREQHSWYYQEYMSGSACSAVFVADGQTAVLLGATRQLVGKAWSRARPFQYCGSVGPLPLTPASQASLCAIGTCVAQTFELQGVFGVDYVESDGRLWPIEVNPRYTASAEILEWVLNKPVVGLHVDACVRGLLPAWRVPDPMQVCGKAVLFICRSITASKNVSQWLLDQNRDASLGGPDGTTWPRFADILQPGTQLRAGAPVLTLFARGDDEGSVVAQLRELAEIVEQRLY